MLCFANLYWISSVTHLLVNLFCGSIRLIYPEFDVENPIWMDIIKYKVKTNYNLIKKALTI